MTLLLQTFNSFFKAGNVTSKSLGYFFICFNRLSKWLLSKILKTGYITVAGFNTSSANLYDGVYSDLLGNLSLTPTPILIGYVLISNANGTIFVNPSLFSTSFLGRIS